MRKAILIIVFFVPLGVCFAQEKNTRNSALVDKIANVFKKIRKFDQTPDNSSQFDRISDSIVRYNNMLISMLTSVQFSYLKVSDLDRISKRTEINIRTSRDKRIIVVSWCTFLSLPQPSCSSVVWFDGNRQTKISVNQNKSNDFGYNIQIDSIIDVPIMGKIYYLLAGTNMCGNLCVKEIASLYSIHENKFEKCKDIFFDGPQYLNEIEFNYVLSDEIKGAPTIQFKNGEVICPVFDEYRSKQIGIKIFKIDVARLGK